MSTPTTESAARRPLTLNRPIKNTLDGSTIAQAKRSPQRHVLPADTTTTLCGIDTAKWVERIDVSADKKINCPLCAKALKAQAKKA